MTLKQTLKKQVRAHYPPFADLSWPRRIRRGFGLLLGVSSLAMAVSAATADSDWNITAEDALKGR